MSLLIGLHDLSPTSLTEYSARALLPDSLYALTLDESSRDGISHACTVVNGVAAGSQQVYGINTGVGFLCTTHVSPDKFVAFQHNIILSHCCGVGEPLPRDLVMMMWVILLNSIAKGHRGVRLETVDFILQTLNAGLLAVVPSQGSVGASGDLVPSAHAAAALLGEGRCTLPVDGRIEEMSAREALQRLGLSPLQLGPKEGLSLINGTQLTTALATKAWYHARRLLDLSNLAAALSIEGLRGQHMATAPNPYGVPIDTQARCIADWLLAGGLEVTKQKVRPATTGCKTLIRCVAPRKCMVQYGRMCKLVKTSCNGKSTLPRIIRWYLPIQGLSYTAATSTPFTQRGWQIG